MLRPGTVISERELRLPRLRRAKSFLVGLVISVMIGSAGTAIGAVGWTWFVDSGGSASGSLATLEPLKVSDARGGEDLLPGEKMAIKVDVENPNRVPLTLVSVDIGDLKSGEGECDASLADSRLRFDRTPDIVVQPGGNDGVVLGQVRLPRLLAQRCQGQTVTADVHVRAAYGVSE